MRFNPFPGLRSFEPDEDHLFFGRDKQVDELLERLRRTRFLAVVGTSGSGKSSLIRSGLVPALYSGFMTRAGSSWRVAIFRPGEDPIGNLAAALAEPDVLAPPQPDATLRDMNRALVDATLRRGDLGLVECVRQANLPPDENLLVIGDQFEELFRFKASRSLDRAGEDAVAFVKLLLEAAAQDQVAIYVVLTMRSDFIGHCTDFPGFVEAINRGQYMVPRMSRRQRREAIVGPVAVGGGEITPRLVTRLLNDVGEDLDHLPILQHALMRTWDYWQANSADGDPLDLHHYEAVGTLKEAMSRHAEEAYRELDDGQREIAERMFKALTDQEHGVRSPRRVEELCELTSASPEEVLAVVERYRLPGRSFLMPPVHQALGPDSIIDLSHESLMRVWTRLVEWGEEEVRSAGVYRRLARAAARYQEGLAGLWRDPELQLALRWKENARPTSAWAQRYDPAFERAMLFLESSREERDRAIARTQRRQKLQLRRTRLVAIGAGVGLLICLYSGFNIWVWKQEAEHNAADAQRAQEKAEANAAAAQRAREDAHRQTGKALEQKQLADAERERSRAAEQEERKAKRRAEQSARQARERELEAVRERRTAVLARVEEKQARERAEALKKEAEASQEKAERLRLQEVAHGLATQALPLLRQEGREELGALLAVHAYDLNQLHEGPGRPEIHEALQAALRTLADENEERVRRHGDAVRAVAVSPDGRAVVAGGDDGGVVLWDLAPRGALGAQPRHAYRERDGAVRALAIDPGGSLAAVGRLDGTIDLLELPELAPRFKPLTGPAAAINALAFTPAGDALAAAGADGELRWWRLVDGGESHLLSSPTGSRVALALSPDGETLATAAGTRVQLWRVAEPAAAGEEWATAFDQVRSLAFSPDGGYLAAGIVDGTVRVWDRSGSEEHLAPLIGHESSVNSLAFSADGELLASASSDHTVRLWHLRDPGEPVLLRGHESWVWTVAMTPDARMVLSGSADATVRLWLVRTEELAERVCALLDGNLTREEWNLHLPPDLPYQQTCPPAPGEAAEPGSQALRRARR